MRSTSSVVVLALVAAAAAAPISKPDVEARAGLSSLGGFSKVLGNVASGAGILSSGINIGNFLGGLFGGDDAAAKRSLDEMEDRFARELIARDVPELEARAGAAGLSKILSNAASGAGILSSGINIGNFLSGLFGGDDAARRELMEVGARELDERAGLASLGKVGNNLLNLGSLGFSLGNIGDAVSGLFSREEAELFAREVDARAGLASLGKVGNNLLNLGSLGFSLGNIGDAVSGLFSRDEELARSVLSEIEDHVTRQLMAREVPEVEARAAAGGLSKILGNAASGAGLLSSGINIGNFLSGLFGGDDAAAKRSLDEIEDRVARELIAREVPELEARAGAAGLSKILGNAASGAGILSSGINIGNFLSGLFGGDDAAARRDLSDVEARAGLASLGKVGNNLLNLGSLGFSLGNIGDAVSGLFSREITEEYIREVIEQETYRRAVADLD